MPDGATQDVTVRVEFGDWWGLIRLMGDVQRFGFHLEALMFTHVEEGTPAAIIGLSVPRDADPDFIAIRFARCPDIATSVVEHNRDLSMFKAYACQAFLNPKVRSEEFSIYGGVSLPD